MSVRREIVAVLLAAAALLLGAWEIRRLAAADASVGTARSRLERTRLDVDEAILLRAAAERVLAGDRPEQDLIHRVNDVCDRIGLDRSAFTSQRAQAEPAVAAGTVDGQRLRRQSVQFDLDGITVAELGAFLAEWQESQPIWTPVQVDLKHRAVGRDDQRYDAAIRVAATYVGTAAPSKGASPEAR